MKQRSGRQAASCGGARALLALGAAAVCSLGSCTPASAQGASASIVTTAAELGVALRNSTADIYLNNHIYVRPTDVLPFVATGRHSIIVRSHSAAQLFY